MPFDLEVDDGSDFGQPPTYPQIFGVFLTWDLLRAGRIDHTTSERLLRGWNAHLPEEAK